MTIFDGVLDGRIGLEERGEHGFGIKIGLHSGPAIVGNVGSERRYNYTAVGETVNIASRLEGLPGIYGCPLLVGDTTRDRLSERIGKLRAARMDQVLEGIGLVLGLELAGRD